MSEDLFKHDIDFPTEVHSLLSMNINSEKLDRLLKFILNMLDRHEQGIRFTLGQDSSSPNESFSFQSFKESLDEKFSSLQRSLLKNSMKIEEIKADLDNRGDTVETLKYVLTTLDEHNASLLRTEKLYNESLAHKENVENTLEDLKNKLYNDNNPILDKSVIQGVEKSREHFPKYVTKRYYVPSEIKPSGIFAQNEEKDENEESSPQNSSLNITKDTQVSNNIEQVDQPLSNSSDKPQNRRGFKRKDRLLQPGRVKEENHEDYLSSASEKSFKTSSKSPIPQSKGEKLILPSLASPPVLSEILSRLESLEKSLLKPLDNPETSTRIRNLEAMYRFIEQILDSCEPLTIRNRDQIMHLVRNLRTLESEMTNKLNTEDFDAVRNLVITLASGAPQHDPTVLIPTAEVNKIRLLEKRTLELEKTLADIVKVYPENIEEVTIKLRRIEQKLAIKISEEDLEPLWKNLAETNEKLKNLSLVEKGIKDKSTNAAKNFENLALNALNRRVSAFEEIIRQLKIPSGLELSQLWEETKKNFQSCQTLKNLLEDYKKQEVLKRQEILSKLETRVDSSSIHSLTESYSKMLQDFSEKCFSTFASQKDLKKLSKFLKEMPKKEPEKAKNETDDAMIAKKPLGGWSCASCEKKLEKLSGRLAGHSPWKKLPIRDASERMLKAGLGYSKMLTSLQLETLKSRVEGEEMLSHRNTDRSHTPYL